MSSLVSEEVLLTVPNPAALGPSPDTIEANTGIFTTLDVYGNLSITAPATFNGQPVIGQIVFTGGTQTITAAKLFQVGPSMDTITSYTAGAGVTISNLRILESTVTTSSINVLSMQYTGAVANTSIAIVPAGTGAIMTTLPDNTAVGGNPRGSYSVDLQISRGLATQVTSGNYSALGGGYSNTVSGSYATVPGGASNVASGNYSTAFGTGSTASGQFSLAGGTGSQATYPGAWVISDSQGVNTPSTANDQFTARFVGGFRMLQGPFGLNDQAYWQPIPRFTTPSNTAATAATLATATNAVYYLTAKFAAGLSPGGAVFRQSVMAVNAAGTVTLSSPFDIWSVTDSSLSTASISFAVSGTSVLVQVTGVSATTVSWTGTVTADFDMM